MCMYACECVHIHMTYTHNIKNPGEKRVCVCVHIRMTYTQKKKSGEKLAPSIACETVEACVEAAKVIGYPVIVRSAFALGGLGSGFAHDQAELVSLVQVSYVCIYIYI